MVGSDEVTAFCTAVESGAVNVALGTTPCNCSHDITPEAAAPITVTTGVKHSSVDEALAMVPHCPIDELLTASLCSGVITVVSAVTESVTCGYSSFGGGPVVGAVGGIVTGSTVTMVVLLERT